MIFRQPFFCQNRPVIEKKVKIVYTFKDMKKGFDNDKYLKIQSEHIKERISHFGNKLYLEFGGKKFVPHN